MSDNPTKSSILPELATLRRESPTLYKALTARLEQDGLNGWAHLEAVVMEDKGEVIYLNPEKARKKLSRVKFIQSWQYDKPDNPEFLAYTMHRVYFQNTNDETGERIIASIPRHPRQVTREDVGLGPIDLSALPEK